MIQYMDKGYRILYTYKILQYMDKGGYYIHTGYSIWIKDTGYSTLIKLFSVLVLLLSCQTAISLEK